MSDIYPCRIFLCDQQKLRINLLLLTLFTTASFHVSQITLFDSKWKGNDPQYVSQIVTALLLSQITDVAPSDT